MIQVNISVEWSEVINAESIHLYVEDEESRWGGVSDDILILKSVDEKYKSNIRVKYE